MTQHLLNIALPQRLLYNQPLHANISHTIPLYIYIQIVDHKAHKFQLFHKSQLYFLGLPAFKVLQIHYQACHMGHG